MHRVELKAFNQEEFLYKLLRQFLMHRVELKDSTGEFEVLTTT